MVSLGVNLAVGAYGAQAIGGPSGLRGSRELFKEPRFSWRADVPGKSSLGTCQNVETRLQKKNMFSILCWAPKVISPH